MAQKSSVKSLPSSHIFPQIICEHKWEQLQQQHPLHLNLFTICYIPYFMKYYKLNLSTAIATPFRGRNIPKTEWPYYWLSIFRNNPEYIPIPEYG